MFNVIDQTVTRRSVGALALQRGGARWTRGCGAYAIGRDHPEFLGQSGAYAKFGCPDMKAGPRSASGEAVFAVQDGLVIDVRLDAFADH